MSMISLAIDGNYILNRNVFSLQKDRLLYGLLQDTLESHINKYSTWFPFDNIYLISDSKSNWRKNIYPEYKSKRTKSGDIDWDFVYSVYNEYKENIPKRIKLLEVDRVEGDDWFKYLADYHNKKEESLLVISNDGDLTQLMRYGKNYMNIMVNENSMTNKVFLPEGYQNWMYNFNSNIPIPGLFDDTGSLQLNLYKFIKNLIDERSIESVNPNNVIFKKIISGDKSDNIITIWGKKDINGTLRGIGEKGSQKMYEKYVEYFGEVNRFDEECIDRIVDLVIETKKLKSDEFSKIKNNANLNNNLVNLNKIPKNIIKLIKEEHERAIS